jgi:1-acyl-sn-glycerol-3-phosphate acyltransferase
MKQEQESSQRPRQRLDHRLGYHLLAWGLRLFFRVYGRWKIIGQENVPPAGPVLFVGNHASTVDPPLAWAALYGTRKMWGIARDGLWKHPVMAYIINCIGAIPVKRQKADRAMLRQALAALEHGDTVGLFPEGTRTYDGLLNPAQPGIAVLVQKSGAPVVPMAFIGTYEMLPRNRKSLKRVPLTVVFGKPIPFPPDATRETITTMVMEAIAALLTAHGRPTTPPTPERAALLAAQEAEPNE